MSTGIIVEHKRVADPLVLGVQLVVSHLTWELGIEIMSFARAVCTVSQ